MKNIIYLLVLPLLVYTSCSSHDDEHKHESGIEPILETVYSTQHELYAEFKPIVKDKSNSFLLHITSLDKFKPIKDKDVSAQLIINDNVIESYNKEVIRSGIYKFKFKPTVEGTVKLQVIITENGAVDTVEIDNIKMYTTVEEAKKVEQKELTGGIVFTKEQAWKSTFETALPIQQPFGQIVKTTGLIKSSQGDEYIVSAQNAGVLTFGSSSIIEGASIAPNQVLSVISGKGMIDNNYSVRYNEAKNNYEKSKIDYERSQKLYEQKLIAETNFLEIKNSYLNAKTLYESLQQNSGNNGLTVKAGKSGFIKKVYVSNGEYVEAGQPLFSISMNKVLFVQSEVQQKYLPILSQIQDVIFTTQHNNEVYKMSELQGKVVSYGKSANMDNYLIPITIQVNNIGDLISGSFVDVFIKTKTNNNALTIVNTALIEDQGVYFVFVQITPEYFEKRQVQIAGTDGEFTEITSGITALERIVTKGAVLVKLAQASGALDPHAGHVH